MVHENCGVIGAFSLNGYNVIPFIIDSLRALQHRGQESWGIAVPKKNPFKHLGLVSSSADKFHFLIEKMRSHVAIGHVRYSTFGGSSLDNAQPLKVKDLCVAHNGTIANVEELTGMVGGCTFTPQTMSDTLIATKRIIHHLSKNQNDINKSLKIFRNEMIGSFCFTFLNDQGTMYAARDSKGFRPLVLGFHKQSETYIVASESCAFNAIGAQLIRDIEPGELIVVNKDGVDSQFFAREKNHAHCAFEYTYFAHPTSIMEKINIYAARKRMGHFLAKKYPLKDIDVVIPVPDSARPAALGYAQEIGIPFEEGLVKDRHINKGLLRSFIEPFQEDRIEINKGIIPIVDVIKGKKIAIVDDSIVRGTSSAEIVKTLRSAGAKSIVLIVTYPPVRFPCYAGIDFPSKEELLANQCENDNSNIGKAVSKLIAADMVIYNDTSNLANAIGLDENELCFTCSSGDYSVLGKIPKFMTRDQIKGNVHQI